ncbi:hypothetical protein [Aurantivibrio plasticivorans]
MMFGFLSLVLPTLCLGLVHLKKYGLSYSREFSGWGAFKAIGLASMMFHFLLLVALGASFFCGFCFYRTQRFAFLFPGIGYALMAFPGVVGQMVLSNFEERHAVILVYIAGAVFALYGLFMASYYA